MILLGILSIALVCATGLAEEELLNTETAISPSDVDHEATSGNRDILTMIGQVRKFLEKPLIVETAIPSSDVDHNIASDNDDIQAMTGQDNEFVEKPLIAETVIPSSDVDPNMSSDNRDIQAMTGQEKPLILETVIPSSDVDPNMASDNRDIQAMTGQEEQLIAEKVALSSDVDHNTELDNHDILAKTGQEKPLILETMIPSSNVDHNVASDNDDIQAMTGQEICGPLEEYRECGPFCEPKCSEKKVVGCVDQCKKGCFCMHSLLRNEDGNCVFPMECKNKKDFSCPKNQQFTMCVQPSTCRTCLNPRGCPTYACNSGCHCKPGYLRDIDGNCIPMEQCPKLSDKSGCPVNEEMVSCVKPIWCNSCEVRGNCKLYSHFCQEGCDCKPKHFRNKYGFCVPEENCSGLDPF